MMLVAVSIVLALGLGAMMPLRWGVFGFIGSALVVFAVQAGLRMAMGFEGQSIEESLLLFNGSYGAYVGWNLQISYRAFALPALVLGAIYVFRLGRTRCE